MDVTGTEVSVASWRGAVRATRLPPRSGADGRQQEARWAGSCRWIGGARCRVMAAVGGVGRPGCGA